MEPLIWDRADFHDSFVASPQRIGRIRLRRSFAEFMKISLYQVETANQKLYTDRMSSRGAALLPTVLVMGAVLLSIGVAGMTLGVALNRSNNSIRLSERALSAARAGVADAARRIIRDPSWAPSCASLSSGPFYALSLAGATSSICASRSGYRYSIEAEGAAQGVKRRIDAEFEVDPTSGKVQESFAHEVSY